MSTVKSYNEPIYNCNDSDELSLKPLNLQRITTSPTEFSPRRFFSTPKFGSPQANHMKMGEIDTSEELYSPATQSVILSPDTAGSYDNTLRHCDWISQDVHSYGRIQNFIF